MSENTFRKIIPLIDQRLHAQLRITDLPPLLANGLLSDQLGRTLQDLRISVTDRCNFRCSYCMPKEIFDKNYTYQAQSALLSFEEIIRLARQFVAHGVRKIRLTGGEPLLRKNIEFLIEKLAMLRTPDGHPLDITLTTNGSLLARKAQSLKDAGLQRVTVSLDALNDAIFRKMNDVDFPVEDVLTGLQAAHSAGLANIKVNMVVKRGTNDNEILPMAKYFQGTGTTLRFIEYMDVGATNGWRMNDVLPSSDVLIRLQSEMQMVLLTPSVTGETAERWGYADEYGKHDTKLGEVGLISSVTQAFCGDCNRARLSTTGQLYLCLFATHGHDLRSLLRQPGDVFTDEKIQSVIANIWRNRNDRYSEMRRSLPHDVSSKVERRVEMSYIGG
jgi:GTP 3',8-cyclase